jgi:regulator of replication initiation timing
VDINPEEVINSLSTQIGALITENTMLKLALAKQQQKLADAVVVPDEEERSQKK